MTANTAQQSHPNPEQVALLVVGSGPAGISAARSYLETGGAGPVVVLTADLESPYMRPPLSKQVLAGTAPADPEPIDEDAPMDRIDLRTGVQVRSVDAATRTAHLADGPSIRAERIVLATGSTPKSLPDVVDGAPVHTLRSLADARELVRAVEDARSAVVVGSGFIGCEAAAALAGRGIATTLVTPDAAPQEPRLGPEAAERIAGWLEQAGVRLLTEQKVAGVAANGTLTLEDGRELPADLVLAAIGVDQQGDLLTGPGVRTDHRRVLADPHLQVADDIWVAGDAALAEHSIAGRRIAVEHWGDALTMGALAGRNAARPDDQEQWQGAPGFFSTIGDRTLKYSAWGDGWDQARLVEHDGDGFTIWYADASGTMVGVLTHEADDDYERGRDLLLEQVPVEQAMGTDGGS